MLSELDPKFELAPDKRFAANVYGKVLKCSPHLRKGVAEGLALMSNDTSSLSHWSFGRPQMIVESLWEKSLPVPIGSCGQL